MSFACLLRHTTAHAPTCIQALRKSNRFKYYFLISFQLFLVFFFFFHQFVSFFYILTFSKYWINFSLFFFFFFCFKNIKPRAQFLIIFHPHVFCCFYIWLFFLILLLLLSLLHLHHLTSSAKHMPRAPFISSRKHS